MSSPSAFSGAFSGAFTPSYEGEKKKQRKTNATKRRNRQIKRNIGKPSKPNGQGQFLFSLSARQSGAAIKGHGVSFWPFCMNLDVRRLQGAHAVYAFHRLLIPEQASRESADSPQKLKELNLRWMAVGAQSPKEASCASSRQQSLTLLRVGCTPLKCVKNCHGVGPFTRELSLQYAWSWVCSCSQ